MRILAVVLIALTACSVDLPALDDGLAICADDGDCPTGFCAVNGRCVAQVETSPLRLEAAVATSANTVELRFDDELTFTISPADFAIEPFLSVTAVEGSGRTIVLTTDAQAFDVVYTVRVDNLTDDQGNPLDDDARSTTFVSFLGQPSEIAPRFTSPAAGAALRESSVRLAWTLVPGTVNYTLDWSTVADFSADVSTVTTRELSHEVTLDRDVTYYARVRADASRPGIYGSVSFDRAGDVIYVACTTTDCGSAGNGTRRLPFTSINLALAFATVNRVTEIRVAARPGGAAYDETIAITGSGVHLRGGFAVGFGSDVPDAVANPTRIAGVGEVVTLSDIAPGDGDVTLDDLIIIATGYDPRGLVVRAVNQVTLNRVTVSAGDPGGGATTAVAIAGDDPRPVPLTRIVATTLHTLTYGAQTQSRGLELDGIGLTIDDCSIEMTQGNPDARALRLTRTPSSTIDDCRITSAQSVGSLIAHTRGTVTVRGSTIDIAGSEAGSIVGLVLDDAEVLLSRVQIHAAGATANTGLEVDNPVRVVVRNSAITGSSAAVYIGPNTIANAEAPHLVIADSTLVAVTDAVHVSGGSASLANNLLVGEYCISEWYGGAAVASAIGNALGCPVFLSFFDQTTEPYATRTDVTTIVGVHARNGVRNRRLNGNIASDAFDAENVFVGGLDYHLTPSTDVNLRQGGTDARLVACGSTATALVACGGDGTDFDGQTRGAPFSFGYDEY